MFLLGFLISTATAQVDLPQLTGSTNNAIPEASSPTATSDPPSTEASATSTDSEPSSATSAAESSSPTTDAPSSTTTEPAPSTQAPPPRVSSSTARARPTASNDGALPSGLPTLRGGFNYPAPTVPPTQGAPFMRKSNLPEGTVFIAVGACLAFLGLAVIAWRGLVAWSLHRSVKRAAMQHNYGDTKSMLRGPGGGLYSHGPGSTLSLDQLGTTGRSSTARSKNHHTSKGNLFFSPTAGAGMHNPGNRGSSYLPAGYYAAGNAAPGGGLGMTHVGSGPISLSTLGPQSHGYSRAKSLGPSPPGSPALPPSRGADVGYARASTVGLSTHASTSTLNLSAPPQGRAPSAYLEDLFANYPPGPTGRLSTDRRH